MRGKTYTQTINFKGTFDAANVLNSLKDIRSSMAKAGADSNLFKNVDKDIASTEKLITEMLAQIQKGFSNPQELNTFQKNFDKLGLSLSKINVGLQDINKASNFHMNTGEIQKFSNEIEQLAAKQEALKKATKDSVTAQLSKISTTTKDRQAIMDQIEAEGDLEEAVKKVAQAREQAAKARNYKKGMETDAGKAIIEEEASNVNAADFGLSAMSGRSKMGTNDARTRKSGHITGLDEAKAAQVFAESYQKTLEEVLKNGGNAVDAVNLMKKAMNDYGVEISEEDKLLDSFSSSIDNFTDKALSDSQKKGIKTGQSLGSTDSRGNFSFSEAGNELANNKSYKEFLQAQQDSVQAAKNLAKAREDAAKQGEQAEEDYKNKIHQSKEAQEESLNAAKNSIEESKRSAEAMETMQSSFDKMKEGVKTFLSLSSTLRMVRQAIQDTFNDIKTLDKSFANIAMVTDYSVQDMWNSYDQYAQMANELGQSTQSVIEASGLYYQQGLDTNESLELTQDTMKLATLAGLDFSEATSQMTAALRGFKMEMNEGERVTDVYAELAAKAAADVEGIATAMSKTASIASSAGMEFETTSAFLTQMIETTQEAPTNIGTAMKTIIARFTELKENVAGTADSEFDDLDYNKVDTALKSVGVSLKDTNGQFRDLDDVFLELASKWDTLDRNSQRYIATIAAGARQQSRFIAMMDNYDRTMELVNVAYDSNGKATEQFGKYSDTLEYKLNQLTNTWEQMRLSFLNSDFLKGAVDMLNNIMTKISQLDPAEIISGIIVALTAGKKTITNILNFSKDKIKIILDFIGSDKKPNPVERMKEKINNLANVIKEPNKINVDTTEAENKINELIIKKRELEGTPESSDETDNEPAFEVAEGPTATLSIDDGEITDIVPTITEGLSDGLGEALDDAGNSSQVKKSTANLKEKFSDIGNALSTSLTVGFTAMSMTDNPLLIFGSVLMSALPAVIAEVVACGGAITAAFWTSTAGIGLIISLIIGAATATYAAVTSILDTIDNNSFENRAKAAQETAENAKKAAEEAKAAAKEATETYNNTEELKERFNELNTKQVLSIEEQEEYNSLVQQIQDEFPEIISYYNETTGELRVQNELWEEILDKQKATAKTAHKNELASTIAYSAAQTDANEYNTISKYSERTGVKGEYLEEYLSSGKDFSELITALDNMTSEINENSLLYSTDADDYGYLTEWIDFDTIGKLYNIDDPSGEGFTKTIQALNEHKDELKESLSGLEQTINDISQQQYNMIAQNFSSVLKEMNPDMGEGEAAFLGALAAENINTNTFTADDYKKQMGLDSDFMQGLSTVYESTQWAGWLNPFQTNKESGFFFDALGGDLGGASENDLSSWGDLDVEDEILGLEQYGIETVGDVKDAFESLYGSATEAEKVWNDLAKTAEGQEEIFSKVVGAKVAEQGQKEIEELQQKMTDEQRNQLNDLYAKTMESGVTQEELDQYKDFLINELGLTQGSLSYNNLVSDLEKSLSDAQQRLEKYNLPNTLWKDWSTDQMNQYANMVDEYGKTSGQTYAENFGKEVLSAFESQNLDPSVAMSAFSAIDWSTVTLGNLDATREKFISTMQTAMGESFSQEKADELWSTFFATADKYNVVDLSISSEAGLQEFENNIYKAQQEIVSGFSGLSSIISEQVENGFISFTSSGKVEAALQKLGMDASEYLNYSNNGEITFEAEKLKNDLMQDQNFQAEALLEKARAETTEKLNELKARRAILAAGNGSVTAAQNLLKTDILDLQVLQQQYEILAARGGVTKKINFSNTDSLLKQASQDFSTTTAEELAALDEQIATVDKYLKTELVKGSKTWNEMVGKSKAGMNELNNTFTKSVDDGIKAKNKNNSSNKKATDSANKLKEAQEKLNEAMYGTKNYKNAVDHLSNYTNLLKKLTNAANDAKESLENLDGTQSASDLIDTYASNVKQEKITITAENQVIAKSIENYKKALLDNYSMYIKEKDGVLMWEPTIMQAKMNDKEKDYILKTVEEINKLENQIETNKKTLEKREKEFEALRKKGLENRITLENSVIDILKEKYQEEIDETQKKYDALKEADDDYLTALEDAINKQRELRDRANEYEDLAQKERKLALKQRDTSGANKKDTLQLQKEVEESRQEMLDNEVDRIIESMKEMYELQQESREAELEYMNAMVENSQLLQEANEIIASFNTRDDMVAWFFENNKELANMSVAATEKYKMELEDMYDAAELYYATSEANLEELTSFTEEEVQNTIVSVGETLTAEGQRSFEAMKLSVEKEINSAKKAVEDAAASSASAVGDAAGSIGSSADYMKNKFDEMMNNQSTNLFNIATPTATGQEEERKGKLAVAQDKIEKGNVSNFKNDIEIMNGKMSAADYVSKAKKQEAKQKAWTFAKNNSAKGKALDYAKYKLEAKQDNKVYTYYFTSKDIFSKAAFQMQKTGIPCRIDDKKYNGFLNGGLVDYTGPAWVDGTPSKPEAFLNSDDTKRIGEAAKLLSNLPILNSTSSASTQLSTNIGDTSIEIHINVDSISSDYDVDRLAERIKSDIVDASKPVGTPVILKR